MVKRKTCIDFIRSQVLRKKRDGWTNKIIYERINEINGLDNQITYQVINKIVNELLVLKKNFKK
jgi:hypothetical protein